MALQIYSNEWLAGLIEAEGHFGSRRRQQGYPLYTMTMNDHDVIDHTHKLLGVGTLTYNRSYFNRGVSQYIPKVIGVYGWAKVQYVASLVGGMLLEKRKQLERILSTDFGTYPYVPCFDWIVGFLEGEGSFIYAGCGTQKIQVSNTDAAILDRLTEFFGCGAKSYVPPPKPHHKPKWVWAVCGKNARTVMRRVYPFMSQRRQFQIDHALAGKQLTERPNYKTLCAA